MFWVGYHQIKNRLSITEQVRLIKLICVWFLKVWGRQGGRWTVVACKAHESHVAATVVCAHRTTHLAFSTFHLLDNHAAIGSMGSGTVFGAGFGHTTCWHWAAIGPEIFWARRHALWASHWACGGTLLSIVTHVHHWHAEVHWWAWRWAGCRWWGWFWSAHHLLWPAFRLKWTPRCVIGLWARKGLTTHGLGRTWRRHGATHRVVVRGAHDISLRAWGRWARVPALCLRIVWGRGWYWRMKKFRYNYKLS